GHRARRRRRSRHEVRDHDPSRAGTRRTRVGSLQAAQPAVRGTGHTARSVCDDGVGRIGGRARAVVEPQPVGGAAHDGDGGWPSRDDDRSLLRVCDTAHARHHHGGWLIRASMSSQHLPLSLLLRILPRTAELAGLRQAMLARKTADPHDGWSGSRAYATLDRRVLTDDARESIFAEAEARSMEHVRTYHRLLRDALREAAAADGDGALARLRDLGEAAAAEGRWETCISYYGAVAAIAAELQDVQLLNLAQRRMGRA